jgi:GT2 family glycosyltransferase
MTPAPRVSVVVTCFNLGRYLDEAVTSVLEQTFQDFEILIVDDGSTDPATVALLAGYDRPKTRVIRIDNRGLPGARNAGIRNTSGEFVCTVDADDRLERTWFEKAVAALDGDASIAFVSHWLETFGAEESEWTPTSADFPALLDRNTINGAAVVRRSALEAVGLLDETMRNGCEDWDLWIGMVESGLRGVILPEILFYYRRRTDSMSQAMMQGGTHIELYRYIIGKHPASFAAHTVDLLHRREVEAATVLREAHDLELDCDAITNEIPHLREHLRVTARKLARLRLAEDIAARTAELGALQEERGRALREEAARAEALGADLARARHDAERSRQDVDRARQETERTREDVIRLDAEVRALRSSLSWRLTKPLRAVYARLLGRPTS